MTLLVHPVNPKYVRMKGDWGSYKGHKGRDYGWVSMPRYVPASRQVLAAAPGKVVQVYDGDKYNDGWGRLVIIEHSSKAFTAYAHFAKDTITVKSGDIVAEGDLIGRMGNSGDTNGTVHLHFEVRINGRGERFRVAPETYFRETLPGTVVKVRTVTAATPTAKKTKQVVTAIKGLNLRAARSTDAAILATFPKDAVVTTTGPEVNGFVRTSRGGKSGYCDARFLVRRARATIAALNLREGPSTDSAIITTLAEGTKVTILSVHGNTDAARWARVHTGTRTGWVHRRFLK